MHRLLGMGRPRFTSVKAYLSELAKDIAEIVVDPVKMERFREQLRIYADLWKQWTTADEAQRQGCWVPAMGRPECIFNIFSRSYRPLKDLEKEAKRLTGSYALCALIHDSQLSHLDKINTDIIPAAAIDETLSAPRNTLEGRSIGNWNSGEDVREIYLIEEFFNRVNVDLQEFCNSEENKLKQASIEEQIQQASGLSDIEVLELTAKKFEERAKKVLSKDETWQSLDRSLKGYFDLAIQRLQLQGLTDNKAGLLRYQYQNLLHYARGINIKSFRGFPDSAIASYARKNASELAKKFKDFAQRAKENSTPKKPCSETEHDDKGQEHFSNPIKIAQKVSSLLTQIPSSKMVFQEQIRDFCEKSNEYNEALKKHLKDVEANHQWKKYGDGKPPYEGWIWDGFHKVWRPTIGFCPDAWVTRYFGWNPFGIFDEPTEPTTQNERLMCEYAVLAAIHDTYLKDLPACDKLYETDNEEIIPTPFPLTKLGEIYEGERIRANIQRALEHVENDLQKKAKKSLAKMSALRILFERIPIIGPALYHLFPMIFDNIKLKIRKKKSPVSPSLNRNERLPERYAIAKNKPWYKRAWAMVVSSIIILAALTTLLLNFDKIIEIFRGETGKQTYSSKPFNGSKLDISLRTICQDIDSRPLTQKKETVEKYVGIKIKEERLKLLEINKNPEGEIYLLSMVFPDQSDTSYSTGRRIICDIPKEQHPELNLAKQGVELYISGQIKEAGAKYIELSDVSLKFD